MYIAIVNNRTLFSRLVYYRLTFVVFLHFTSQECFSSEEDLCISEQEILRFKANQSSVSQQRRKLREKLRQQFNNLTLKEGLNVAIVHQALLKMHSQQEMGRWAIGNGQRIVGMGGKVTVLERQLPCPIHVGRKQSRVSVVTVERLCMCVCDVVYCMQVKSARCAAMQQC